jgi:alkylhydroperoxidase/carboxymuconolactone decarboxylase family protein YurZ
MYLPKIYEKFSSKFPDVFKDFQQLGKSCRDSGPLEKKYQDLANLGIAIGANKALESGAGKEEIAHVVLLSLTTIGFPNMIAAMGWVDEVIEGA